MVGVDGSPNSIAALKWAARFARGSGATVYAVYVWRYPRVAVAATPLGMGVPPPEIISDAVIEELTGFIAAAELPSDVHVVPKIREGSPAQVLLHEARHADLNTRRSLHTDRHDDTRSSQRFPNDSLC